MMLAIHPLVAAFLTSVVLTGSVQADCEITLRSADTHPDDHPTVDAVLTMGTLLRERTGGRICLEVFADGQLGDEAASIGQTLSGAIDMTRVSLASFDDIEETRILALPYLFRSVRHMRATVDGPIGDAILAAFRAGDLIGLAFYDAGARSFYTSAAPITATADLAGLRIRVIESDVNIDMIAALRATAVTMPFGQVHSALRSGAIDGAENTWPNYVSGGHQDVARYYTPDRHLIVPEVLVMSRTAFDGLAAVDRAIVRQAARDSVAVQRVLWDAFEATAEARLHDAGITVVADFDRQPFVDAMIPVHAKYVTSRRLADLVARVQAVE